MSAKQRQQPSYDHIFYTGVFGLGCAFYHKFDRFISLAEISGVMKRICRFLIDSSSALSVWK